MATLDTQNSYAVTMYVELRPNNSTSVVATLPLVQENGEDVFVKSPFKCYLTIASITYKILNTDLSSLRGNNTVYTWSVSGIYTGSFLFRQDLKEEE